MAIERRPPNTILLGGGGPGAEGAATHINNIKAGAVITPGMLIETYDDNGVTKWRPHSGAAEMAPVTVALEQLMLNLGVDDNYEVGDLVQAASLRHGSMWWALVPSGQDIANQEFLQSNGDGLLRSASATTAAAGVARFKAHEGLGAVTVRTRVRAEVL